VIQSAVCLDPHLAAQADLWPLLWDALSTTTAWTTSRTHPLAPGNPQNPPAKRSSATDQTAAILIGQIRTLKRRYSSSALSKFPGIASFPA